MELCIGYNSMRVFNTKNLLVSNAVISLASNSQLFVGRNYAYNNRRGILGNNAGFNIFVLFLIQTNTHMAQGRANL